jgi:hypothetical protein
MLSDSYLFFPCQTPNALLKAFPDHRSETARDKTELDHQGKRSDHALKIAESKLS